MTQTETNLTLEQLSQQLPENSEKTTPKTIEELLASGNPWVRVGDQYIGTEKWPDTTHSKCKGTGYLAILLKPAPKMPLSPNAQCFCKSGKKFKKCCQSGMERMRRSGHISMCACVGKAFFIDNPTVKSIQQDLKEKIKEAMKP